MSIELNPAGYIFRQCQQCIWEMGKSYNFNALNYTPLKTFGEVCLSHPPPFFLNFFYAFVYKCTHTKLSSLCPSLFVHIHVPTKSVFFTSVNSLCSPHARRMFGHGTLSRGGFCNSTFAHPEAGAWVTHWMPLIINANVPPVNQECKLKNVKQHYLGKTTPNKPKICKVAVSFLLVFSIVLSIGCFMMTWLCSSQGLEQFDCSSARGMGRGTTYFGTVRSNWAICECSQHFHHHPPLFIPSASSKPSKWSLTHCFLLLLCCCFLRSDSICKVKVTFYVFASPWLDSIVPNCPCFFSLWFCPLTL